jgi:hypothetical protein
METSITLNPAGFGARLPLDEAAAFAVEAERLGIDTVWAQEAWGTDAFTPLAHLAALTTRVKLGTGIAQVTARAPAMLAMSAMTLDDLSGGPVPCWLQRSYGPPDRSMCFHACGVGGWFIFSCILRCRSST